MLRTFWLKNYQCYVLLAQKLPMLRTFWLKTYQCYVTFYTTSEIVGLGNLLYVLEINQNGFQIPGKLLVAHHQLSIFSLIVCVDVRASENALIITF